jgi:hypothetical protein
VGGGVDSSATVFRSSEGASKVVQTSLADAACHCLDLATGRPEWTFRMGPSDACSHATGRCVLNGSDGYFTERACCRSYTTPLVRDFDDDGQLEVLVGSMNGSVHLLDARTGLQKERLQTAGAVRGSPILADLDLDGRLELVVCSGRRLLVYATRATGEDWPMFKGDPSLAGPGVGARRPERVVPKARTPLAEHVRLLRAWTVSDLDYFVRTRIDKHVLNRVGRRRMDYWY